MCKIKSVIPYYRNGKLSVTVDTDKRNCLVLPSREVSAIVPKELLRDVSLSVIETVLKRMVLGREVKIIDREVRFLEW